MSDAPHVSVLLTTAVDALAIRPDGTYVDMTFGAGGHSALMLAALGPSGRLIAFDADPSAGARAIADPRFTLLHANFRELAEQLDALEIAEVDGVLMDLGVSSMQLDEGDRGFSFRTDAPLDMRLDTSQGETVADFLADRDEKEIADAIYQFGEERASRRIARAIVNRRVAGDPVLTTAQLAETVQRVLPRTGKIHPATRTFQALRIAVNDELGALRAGLDASFNRVSPGGRIAVISFHSLEDRIVKHTFREDPRVAVLTRKPMIPEESEIRANPRSRSAKLRVAEVLPREEAA
jgi:16S rRNA (cytosine1402-N4)-methyltransferase